MPLQVIVEGITGALARSACAWPPSYAARLTSNSNLLQRVEDVHQGLLHSMVALPQGTPAATAWVPMGARVPMLTSNDHPNPLKRRQQVSKKKSKF